MPASIHRFRAALVFILLGLLAPVAHAQRPPRGGAKLDALLAASLRGGDPGTKQVIIRTRPNGIPGLTDLLRARGHQAVRIHSIINAVTARVPVPALEALAQSPFVESISIDAKVVANQDVSSVSTLRGTLALPLQTSG